MKFEICAELKYAVQPPATLVLNIHALKTAGQIISSEDFVVTPAAKYEELLPEHKESRLIRIELLKEEELKISYKAVVNNSYKAVDLTDATELSIAKLHPAVFTYLYPSRYCQSDKLYRFANNKFGSIKNPFLQVLAITNWIHSNIEYLSGSTNSQTSAYDTITELAGVCRDFAHLGIALCRALTIPARYFTGYAYKLYPQDFHACFEAYINGQWIIFDATRLVPLNGLVKIATGLDAADSSVANLYGNINCNEVNVSCKVLEEDSDPLYYNEAILQGISY